MKELSNVIITSIFYLCAILLTGYVMWKILELIISAFQQGSNCPKYMATTFIILELFLIWLSPALALILLLIGVTTMTILTKIYHYKIAKLKRKKIERQQQNDTPVPFI